MRPDSTGGQVVGRFGHSRLQQCASGSPASQELPFVDRRFRQSLSRWRSIELHESTPATNLHDTSNVDEKRFSVRPYGKPTAKLRLLDPRQPQVVYGAGHTISLACPAPFGRSLGTCPALPGRSLTHCSAGISRAACHTLVFTEPHNILQPLTSKSQHLWPLFGLPHAPDDVCRLHAVPLGVHRIGQRGRAVPKDDRRGLDASRPPELGRGGVAQLVG